MIDAAGPLGKVLALSEPGRTGHPPTLQYHSQPVGPGANPQLLLRRAAFPGATAPAGGGDPAERAVLNWAAAQHLGQQDNPLLAAAHQRRVAAVQVLTGAAPGAAPRAVRVLAITALGRLAVGLGQDDNPLEVGIALHGTYGWPIIPGSSIKGMACAWAVENHVPTQRINSVFGSPRPHAAADPAPGPDEQGAASVGAVWFLDAHPAGLVPVARDVLTPHLQRYYQDSAGAAAGGTGAPPEPPAEFRNPVPKEFLTVEKSGLQFALVGPEPEVGWAAEWCIAGFDELGVGGKTAAGYGYAQVSQVDQ